MRNSFIALSISGIQMTFTYTGILIMPAVFGLLAQHFSAGLYPWYLLMLAVLTVVAFLGLAKHQKTIYSR